MVDKNYNISKEQLANELYERHTGFADHLGLKIAERHESFPGRPMDTEPKYDPIPLMTHVKSNFNLMRYDIERLGESKPMFKVEDDGVYECVIKHIVSVEPSETQHERII